MTLGPQQRLVAACGGALFVPLCWPLLTGQVFTRDDLAALHLPFRYLYRQALWAGESFLWTPAYRSGFYLHGEGEAGMAHPLHLLLYGLFPLGIAFNLEIIASYVAMLVGTAVLLRRLGLSLEAALFGAVTFTFSGFNLFNLMHVNHIATVAHLPWLLLCAHALLTSTDRRGRAAAFAGAAMTVGSEVLVGNPQYLWLTLVAVGSMTLCLLYAGSRVRYVLFLVSAMALGVLIGAVQLLPTLDFLRDSTRIAWSLDERLTFSLSPLNLVQLWSPFAFQFRVVAPPSESQMAHEFIVYNGAFCTVALAWIAMRWRQQTRRRLLTALLAFAAISLVLALGRYGGVYAWLSALPGLRNVRAPARHLVLFQFALSGIAAVAFEDLLTMIRRGEKSPAWRLWPLAVPVVLAVTTTAVAAALVRSSWASAHGLPFAGLTRAAPWAGLVVVVALVVALAARGVRWAVPVLIAATAFDQGLWGYSYALRWGPLQTIAELAAAAPVPPNVRPGDLISPAIEGGIGNVAILRGVRLTTGYTGLLPSSILDPTDPVTERIAGVAWRASGGAWVALPDSMPRARLVSVARRSTNIKADVPIVDISRVALVDREVDGLGGGSGSANVVTDRPGSIVVETTAAGRQLLVLTERFHPGWRAEHDDGHRDLTRVYGDFLGCVVDKGRHRVTFTFAPLSARAGIGLSLAGLALTALTTTVLWRRHVGGRPLAPPAIA